MQKISRLAPAFMVLNAQAFLSKATATQAYVPKIKISDNLTLTFSALLMQKEFYSSVYRASTAETVLSERPVLLQVKCNLMLKVRILKRA